MIHYKKNKGLLYKMYELACEMEGRVGVDRKWRTYQKYMVSFKHVESYIHHMGKSDINIKDVDKRFVVSFVEYLSRLEHLSSSSIWIYLMPLKKVVNEALRQGHLAESPFRDFKITPKIRDREFLDINEVRRIRMLSGLSGYDSLVRDAFVFSCLTGLSFSDIKNLRDDAVKTFRQYHWIIGNREKTGETFMVRLLPDAFQILEERLVNKSATVFPIGSNTYVNARVKQIVRMAGISKEITFHCARHTFAVLALNSGMAIEHLSKVLGHKNISTTQIYAKVTPVGLERDFEKIEVTLCGKL